jgi:hypothetical protein
MDDVAYVVTGLEVAHSSVLQQITHVQLSKARL